MGRASGRKARRGALALLEPRVAVPIHWGTLHRIGLRRVHRALQSEQPRIFEREAATLAPSVEVRILQPGEETTVEPVRRVDVPLLLPVPGPQVAEHRRPEVLLPNQRHRT